MMKKFNFLIHSWIFLFIVSVLTFTACSDKDVNETEVIAPSDPYGKTTDDAEALLAILHATADVDSLPNDWNKANYKEEPTIGKVLDEANPYMRSTGSASAEEAISFFNSITSSNVKKSATSASWSKEGIGSINLNVVNKDGVYATIDVHVQQLPHLTQIRFIDKNLLGENADAKPAYYQIGDVVSTVEDGQTIYWVCVRNCNKSFGKEKSHWVSFQLSDKNYKTYEAEAKKGRAQLTLPTKLSSSKDVTEDIENTVKLFVALSNPSKYDEINAFKDGLGGFKKVTYPTSMIRNIISQWAAKGIKEKLLPAGIIELNSLSYEEINNKEVNVPFYYYGHSQTGSTVKLYRTTISMTDESFEKVSDEAKWTWDDKSFNIKSYVQNGTRIASGIAADNPEKRTDDYALVIRCKTGKELCGKGSTWGNDPDYTKPFPDNAPTKVTEVYHYDENARISYVAGDLVESSDGANWTCILSPCNGNNKTIFVTTDKITYSKDKKVITNNDLATISDIYYIYPWLLQLKGSNYDAVRAFCDNLEASSFGAIPISQYLQLRTYRGSGGSNGYVTTFAVRSNSDKQNQPLLRMYQDVSDRKWGPRIKGFTKYQDNQKMYLEDAGNMESVNKYIQNDTLSKNFWISGTNGPTYRSKAGHSTVDSYLYYRAGTMINGKPYSGFADPEDFYSIFMEPVAVLRVRILEPGEVSDFKRLGINLVTDKKIFTQCCEQYFPAFNTYFEGAIYLDGSLHSVSYTGQ